MPITKAISSKANVKQPTNQDVPYNPSQIVTASYGPVASTSGQTIVNLSFAVTQTSVANFFFFIDGKLQSLGSANDYTFTSIQANNTSSQITLNKTLPAGFNISAVYLGIAVPNFSLASVQAQVNTLITSSPTNALINGAFDFWQRAISVSVANNSGTYGADRWYCGNSSGVAATYSQVTGTLNGSKYGASIAYGASATTSSLGMYQVIENFNTLPFINQTASVGVWIKGLGNTNQVTVALFYTTSETKTIAGTLATQNFTINSSGFTCCSINNIAIGNSMTTSGCLQLGIQVGSASTGNAYASGNGIVVEQAMLNSGSVAGSFVRAGRNTAEELSMCQRYYEKTYDVNYLPGAINSNSELVFSLSNLNSATHQIYIFWYFKANKRVLPSISSYSPQTGTIATIRDTINNVDLGSTIGTNGTTNASFYATQTTASTTAQMVAHMIADADI